MTLNMLQQQMYLLANLLITLSTF